MTGALAETAPGAPSDISRDASLLGVPVPPSAGDASEGVWPQNVEAVSAYLAVHTQWRIVPLADGGMRAVGLDYTAVRTAFEMLGVGTTPQLWSDLQMIEIGARAALNGEKT